MTSPPVLESAPLMEHKFVFLCGLHRSGRSVLHRILCAHPEVSGFENTGVTEDEGELLQNVYPKSRNFGGPGKFCFAPDAYLTEKSRLVNDTNRVRLFAQWQPYWDVKKPFLLEKSGSNITQSRFLQAMFPNSYFIFLLRHPVAVTLAGDKADLANMPEKVEHWTLAHRAMLEDRNHLKRHLMVRYEDMIARPDHCLRIVYDFLGLSTIPVKETLLSAINREYFKLWDDYKISRPKVYTDVMKFSAIPSIFKYVFDTPYVNPIEVEKGTKVL
jgi:hypothetical protein